jgi:hypothetical protein
MKILIIGIYHDQQPIKNGAELAPLRAAKDALEEKLKNEIEARNVGFIGEESKHGIETIGKRLADEHNPKILWANIDMLDEEEKEAGIFDALQHRPFETDYDESGALCRKYLRIPEDEIRERFFVEKTKKNAEDAESILVICGHEHVGPLKEKLEGEGDQVETVDGVS